MGVGVLLQITPPSNFDIAPYLSAGVLLLVAVVTGGFAIYNRRRGNVETKAPSVAESWQRAEEAQEQLDIERNLRRFYQGATETLRALVRRILTLFGAGAVTLTPDEEQAMNANPSITKEN